MSVTDSDVEMDDKGPSLYDKIVEITSIEYKAENYDSIYEWKASICRYFTDNYPEDADFERLDPEVQEWVNETTSIVVANRGAARRKALPLLPGLEGDEETVPKKRGRKPAAEKKVKEPKVKKEKVPRVKKEKVVKEPKVRGPNRYLRAMRALLDNPELTVEELAVKIDVAPIAATYCLEAYKSAVIAFEEHGWVKAGTSMAAN